VCRIILEASLVPPSQSGGQIGTTVAKTVPASNQQKP
jgi:hypothetical protein